MTPGNRPQLLEHLAELYPRHIQIHYGKYQRDELYDAARRSKACAYLADDDHGPLALQEIMLAGCPVIGVRTGASLISDGETGVIVDRLPPGAACVECDADTLALDAFIVAIEQAQTLDRGMVRGLATGQFDTDKIIDALVSNLQRAVKGGNHCAGTTDEQGATQRTVWNGV